MKGKLAVIIASMLVVSAIPDVSGKAAFNPVLPCKVEHHGQSQMLPLGIFGDDAGYIDMYNQSIHNQTQFKLFIKDYSSHKTDTDECQTPQYETSQDNQIIIGLNSKYGKIFKELGLIVSVDNTIYTENAKFSVVSFFDTNSHELIGSKKVDTSTSSILEVLSRRYFTLGFSNLWDIKKGWVDCVNDGLYGFSPKTYYKSGSIYSRLDDSFMFRYDDPELEDYGFLGIQGDDYVYRAKDISDGSLSRMSEIIKINFKGEIVQRWKTDFLEPGMDSVHCFYVCDNIAMIYCESREYPRNYRLFNLDTGEVIWNFGLTPQMNGTFTFVAGTFYIQGSYMAAKVKPDGTITYVYFPGNPQYVTLNGQQYYFKGIPASDPESLMCRLVRLEEDGEVETDLVVPFYPNFIADGNQLVGWRKLDDLNKDKNMASYEYCVVQNLGKSGFSKPYIKQAELSEYDCSVDFAHLKAVELVDNGKAKIIDLSGGMASREISILEPGENVADYINLSVLSKGDFLALYRQDISGNDFFDCATVYNIATGKRISHKRLKQGSGYIRTDSWLTSNYKTDNLCLDGNVLIAWRKERSQINIINLLGNELIDHNDNDHLLQFNNRIYYRYKDKFMILNPETLEKKEFDNAKVKSTEPLYLLWLEQCGLDQVFGEGSYPQWYIPGVIYHKVGGWFASDSDLYAENDYIQVKSCPTFSIKRSSNDEFQIKNTSPNCDTPLNANVYLIKWSDQGCPAYWQARDVVGRIEGLKLNETTAIKVSDLASLQSKKFALVIESKGLLDTSNSELSDFDKTDRPLFDGNSTSYEKQQSVVLTVWSSNSQQP